MTGPPWEIRRQWMAAARQPDLAAQLLDILMALGDRVGISLQPGSQQPGDAYSNLFPEDYRRATVKPGSRLPGAQEYPSQPVIYPGESQGQRGRRPVTSWDGYVTGAAEAEDAPGADDYDRIFPAWYRRRCPGGGD
jgi:hypothetical protein